MMFLVKVHFADEFVRHPVSVSAAEWFWTLKAVEIGVALPPNHLGPEKLKFRPINEKDVIQK